MSGSALDQTLNSKVWVELYQSIERLLNDNQVLVVDATNARVQDRRNLIRHCRKFAGRIEGAWFVTSLEECLRRNELRERKVPEHAIERMYNLIERDPPDEEDGFDLITIVIPSVKSQERSASGSF